MRIDLEELVRKARGASPGNWRVGTDDGMTGTSILREDLDADLYQVADRASPEDAVHIAANSPPVTLALVARIRELEAGLRRLAVSGKPQSTWINTLLEKGAVLP